MKIKKKTFIVLTCCSLLPLIFTSILFYSSQRKTLKEQVYNQLKSIASLQHSRIESIINQNIERINLVSSRTQLRFSLEKYRADGKKVHQDKMIRILNDAKASIKSFHEIFIVSLDGEVVASTAQNFPAKSSIHFDEKLFIRGQKETSADTLFLDEKDNVMLMLAGPLHLNGDLLGVIFIKSDTNNLISSVTNYTGLGKTGEIIIAKSNQDGDALFLMPTRFDKNAALKRKMHKKEADCPIIKFSQQHQNLIGTGVDYRGHPVSTVEFHIDQVNWFVIVKIDTDEALASIIKMRNLLAAIILTMLVGLIFLSNILAKFITLPIKKLTDVALSISAGDVSKRADATSKDEVGILASSFNSMAQKLIAATEEWEKTFNAMSDIVTIQDKEMRIVKANKATYDFFKLKPGDLEGKYCYEIFRGTNQLCQNCPELKTLNDRQTHSENITHENLGKIFHVTSSPILDERGEYNHVVHIAKDITEHKKMEEELLQAHKMEAIGTLAGGIAHDFNNILSVIIGYADLAQLDLPDGSSSQNEIKEVLKAGNRAKELVSQILTFSRKELKKQGPLQPSSIIKETLKLIRASLPTTIKIVEDIDPDCGYIIANPTNIHQILMNLCTNAQHAMEDEKGLLTVKLTKVQLKDHEVMLESGVSGGSFIDLMVSDTGCGMDKKTVQRVFEPYYTTKEVGKGSGMGLALVHGIVKNCGAFITVDSKPGKGSNFHVYFPSIPSIEKEDFEVEEKRQEPLPMGNERILAVDDEKTIVNLYQTTLEKLGYKVTAFSSSQNAFDAFQSSPDNFDLIITDQTMPNLTGAELAKKILKINPDIPIILCTGYSTMISKEKALEIGITKFIMKPVEKDALAKAVREVLDKAELRGV